MNVPDQGTTPVTGADPQQGAGFDPANTPERPLPNSTSFAPDEENTAGPGRWEQFVDKLHQASMDSPVGFMSGSEGALQRSQVQGDMEAQFRAANRTKISADEANKLYPDLPKPFEEPVYPEIADLINSDNQRRRNLQAWIDRGPKTGILTDLGVGAVAGFADPLNLGLMAATGGASRALGVGEGLAGVFGQNLAINAGTAALTYPQLKKERQDVSLSGEAFNAVTGALGGTALHFGLSAALAQAGRFAGLMSGSAAERNLRAAIAQHETGATIDMAPAVAETQLRAAGAVQPDVTSSPYEFRPIEHPSERTFYTARDAENNAPIHFQDLGPGVHAVDNGMVANNLASSPESIHTGRVGEIQIPEDAKLLDLDEPLPRELADKISEEHADADVSTTPAKDVLRELPQEAQTAIRAELEKQGYDGYRYVNADQGAPHNGVVLFDEARAELGREFEANKEITPRMSEDEAQAASERAQSPDASRLADPEVDQRLERLKAQAPEGIEPAKDDTFFKEQETNAKAALKTAAQADPKLLEDPEYKEFLHQETQDRQELQVLKDFVQCMARDFT